MARTNKPTQDFKDHGTTLVELVVAVSMMAVIMAVIVPVIVSARLSWDTSSNNAEALQNGRVLIDHLYRNLSQASSIESVSSAGQTLGYIEFTDDDNDTYRYQVDNSDFVEYGEVGSLIDLAGTVSQLQFTCYDGNDMASPITDVNQIRLIDIEVTVTNTGALAQDKVFSTSVFMNRDPATVAASFEGWWCLDDASGTTAADSSGSNRDGTLVNMAGDEWVSGTIGGALEFDGYNDHVELPIGTLIETTTDCTVALWVNWSVGGDWQTIFDFGSDTSEHMYLVANDSDDYLRFAITDNGWNQEERIETTEPLGNGWHHVAVTIDDANTLHTLYLDGEVIGQNTNARTNPSDMGETTDNWLGRPHWNDSDDFEGLLDDVRFYGRALSAQEISDLASGVNFVQFEDFMEAKASSDVMSLAISTPPGSGPVTPVSFLGGSVGAPFTVPAGSNRLLVFTAHVEDYSSDLSLTSVTYGGQTMTKVVEELVNEKNVRAYVVAFILDESGIASASGNEFVKSWTSTPDYGNYYTFAVENVNQYAPISSSGSKEEKKKDNVDLDDPLSTGNGDMVILAATAGNDGYDYEVRNGFTEAQDFDFGGTAAGVVGYYSADGNDVTPEVDHDRPNRQVLIGFVIRVHQDNITGIEGDLLIATVATEKSETISAPAGEGWTQLSHGTGDGQVTVGVWAKLAGASESPVHIFTWGSNEEAYGWIMRFTGHDPSNPIDVMAEQGGGATWNPPSPSVTTTVNNAMILRIGGFDHKDVTTDDSGLPGYVTITMDNSSTNGGSVSGGAAYVYESAGSTGSETFSLNDDEQYRTITLAIAPAPE